MRAPLSSLALISTLVGAAALLTPAPAEACGGTFCDAGPPMPVDQRGEDILFIRDGTDIEVHVRIQYTGEAERFAWLVPLQAVPEVSVGSEPLFVELGRGTIPFWTTTRTFEDPDDNPNQGGAFVPNDGGPDPEPEVVVEEVVGAFEVVVLEGGTAQTVIDFLDANDYAQDPEAAPILQEYLDEGFLFAAVKLTAGAEVDAIHPLVFRFPGDEPCVPIRLTRIAAEEDMGIRAYFLGAERWAPSNYAHVVPNPLHYDWDTMDFASYIELLSMAVDEAGGQAWATEYAGPSTAVNPNPIYSPLWEPEFFVDTKPLQALALLDDMGFWLGAPPAQVRALLLEYVPPPPGYPEPPEQFWLIDAPENPELVNEDAWDGAAFAADFEERVSGPALHAVNMLEAWPYLTRLHTTMSPAEMTLDPTFHPAPDLPAQFNGRSASAFVYDDFTWTRYTIPFELLPNKVDPEQEERVCVRDDGTWPAFAAMPYALRVEELPAMGPAQVVTDNEAEILAILDSHNLGSPCESSDPGGTGDGGTDTGGDEAGTDGDELGLDDMGEAASCACTAEDAGPFGTLGLALGLFALACVGRRRRDS